ncbi:MAG: cache domain-containing protein [Gammaproteobacteria bacterium]|nr:cache domain-containing protein [Gammaproteobacteria bacterium]
MSKVQGTAGATLADFGEQAITLLRALALYALLLAVPVTAYYFAVVERQAEARSEQAFHALKRIQSEFDTRLAVLDYLLDAPVQDGGPPPALRYSEVGVTREAVDRASDDKACPTAASDGNTVCRDLREDAGGARLRASKHGTVLAIDAERLLDAPAALRRFERVVLADEQGKVITSVTAPVEDDPERVSHRPVPDTVPPVNVRPFLIQAARDRLRALAGRGNPAAADATEKLLGADLKLGEAAEISAEIGGHRYRIYLLPFAPEKPVHRTAVRLSPLYLVGIERQSAIADATAALGVDGLWYLLVAMLLTIAAWPLLRVLLLGNQEAATRATLAATLISVVFIPALLTLVILVLMARGDEHAHAAKRAAAYADAIAAELSGEVHRLLGALDDYGPRFAARAPLPALDSRLLQCDGFKLVPTPDTGTADSCRFDGRNPNFCQVAPQALAADGLRPRPAFETLFATDAIGKVAGAPYLTTGGCQPRAAVVDLSEREYFRSLARGGGWPLPKADAAGWHPDGIVASAGRYFAQRIYAKTDGTRTLVVAVPQRRPDGGFAGVLGVAADLRALSAALRPPYLGFAVVDPLSGTVLFHSDDDTSLHENFLDEVDRDVALVQAIGEGRRTALDGHYRGRRHHFQTTPVPGMPWVVVSFFDAGRVAEPAIGSGLLALAEMIGLIALLALIALLFALLVVPACRLAGWNLELWQWLWPQWRLRRYYFWLGMALLLPVSGSQIVLWMATDDMTMSVVIAIGTVGMTVWAVLCMSSLRPWQAAPLAAGIRQHWQCRDRDDRRPTPVDTLRELRHRYVVAVMAGVIALAVLPAAGYYLNALPRVEEAQLRQALIDTGRSLDHRIAALTGDTRRAALDGMAMVGRPAPAVVQAAQARSIGVDWTPETGSAGDCAAASAEAAGSPPSWLLREVWPVLAGLLPTLVGNGPPSAGDTRFRRIDGPASQPACAPALHYRHSLRYDGTATLSFRERYPAPLRLRRIYDAGNGAIGTVAMTGVIAIALLLVYLLVQLIARRVLGLDLPYLPPLPTLGPAFAAGVRAALPGRIPARDAWWYVLAPEGGGAPQAPAARATIQLIGPERLGNDRLAMFATSPLAIVGVADAALLPDARRTLLALIEREVARAPAADDPPGARLLLTAATPPWPRLCYPDLFPAEDDGPDAAEARRWRELRRHFACHHAGDGSVDAVLPLVDRIDDRHLRRAIADELVALVELTGEISAALHSALDAALARVPGAPPPLRDLRDLEQLVMPYVEANFRCEWAHCSIAERIALHQLARGLLPNPLNRTVLDDLLARRLAVLAPEPRIVCSAFRSFVLRAEPASRYAQWTLGFEVGTWSRVRVPFYLLLLLLVAWFSYSFSDAFTTLNTLLAGTLGMIATFGRVSSLVRGGKEAEK